MSEPREFPIVAGPDFEWPNPYPTPLRDSSIVDNYDVNPPALSNVWQDLIRVDEVRPLPATGEFQDRMSERVRRILDLIVSPGQIRAQATYSIPSPTDREPLCEQALPAEGVE